MHWDLSPVILGKFVRTLRTQLFFALCTKLEFTGSALITLPSLYVLLTPLERPTLLISPVSHFHPLGREPQVQARWYFSTNG